MKRKYLMGIAIVAIISVSILLGFEKKEKYHFNVDVNKEYLDLIQTQSPNLLEEGNNKFGGDLSKSSLNVHFTDFEEAIRINENTFKQDSNFKGVVKTISGNFNFSGSGTMYTFELSNGELIKVGEYKGDIKNKKSDDTFTLSIRFNPKTDEVDIVGVSGLAGDGLATLPFGNPFLYDNDLDEIHQLKTNIE